MYEYSVLQWLAFFFIYCFLGWCFESLYVSIKSKHPVNRGFMRGPLLPIYGTGAITILFVALPFREIPVLVYITGMIAATLLEYVVGVAMEALFKVRYWDYSNQKFNFQGHICLSSSIVWGFFSVALVYGMHKPFEKFVLGLPYSVLSTITLLISVVAAADFMVSLKTALDIRDLIIQAEKMRDDLNRMKRRIEIIDTFTRAELESRREQLLDHLEETMEERFGVEVDLKERFGVEIDLKADLKERFQDSLDDMEGRVEQLRGRIFSFQAKTQEKKQQFKEHMEELGAIHTSLAVFRDRLQNQSSMDKKSMLRRNPGARYSKLPGFLEELREGMKKPEENGEK